MICFNQIGYFKTEVYPFGNMGSTSDEYVRDMSIDSTNQVVMTGDFRDILDFDLSAKNFF